MTIKQAKDYIIENYGQPRHDISSLVKACRVVAKKFKADSDDVFFLVIENKPITYLYTHSYGFHTANGREIINNVHDKYYEYHERKVNR